MKKIRWIWGSVSREEKPTALLEDLPTCGNCHSFTPDGRKLAMDVDANNDKGAYVITSFAEKHISQETASSPGAPFRKGNSLMACCLRSLPTAGMWSAPSVTVRSSPIAPILRSPSFSSPSRES